jgi:2'-5' RNA ligase
VRLFFALWPGADTRTRIARIASAYAIDAERLTPAGDLHLTLQFLGEVDDATRVALRRAAGQIRAPAFLLTLNRGGLWRRAGVAWLAPATIPAALAQLAQDLHAASRALGIAVESRPFTPHVTLARRAHTPPHLPRASVIEWQVTDFALISSRTLASGAHYDVLQRWPLWALPSD